jgi:hypothetical protein
MLVSGCVHKQQTKINYAVAVVETTATTKKSLITYYSKQLKPVKQQPLKYAALGSIWNNEIYSGGKVFLIPTGLTKMENEHKVLGIDKRNGDATSYRVDRTSIQGIAVSSSHIYTTSNLNAVNYITQVNRKSNKVKEIELPFDYVSLLMYRNGNLFVFSTNFNDIQHNRLFIYNDKLELKRKVDLAEVPQYIQKATFLNNKLVFTATFDPNEPKPAELGIVNLDSWQVSTFRLKESAANDIIAYKDKLIVANTDVVESRGKSISLIDLHSKEVTLYDLNTGVDRLALSGDTLYALGADELASFDAAHGFAIKKHIKLMFHEGLGRSALFVAKP